MYIQKVISKNKLKKKYKSRIWIHKSLVRIRESGYVLRCHGSTTLLTKNKVPDQNPIVLSQSVSGCGSYLGNQCSESLASD
jgi:hypothetical protein